MATAKGTFPASEATAVSFDGGVLHVYAPSADAILIFDEDAGVVVGDFTVTFGRAPLAAQRAGKGEGTAWRLAHASLGGLWAESNIGDENAAIREQSVWWRGAIEAVETALAGREFELSPTAVRRRKRALRTKAFEMKRRAASLEAEAAALRSQVSSIEQEIGPALESIDGPQASAGLG